MNMRQDLTDEAARCFAEMASIPVANIARLRMHLDELIDSAHSNDEWDRRAKNQRSITAEKLENIEKAASALLTALDDLDDRSRKHLAVCAVWHDRFIPDSPIADDYGRICLADIIDGGFTGEGLRQLDFYRHVIDKLRLVASTKVWPSTPKGGRPSSSFRLPGNPNVTAYDRFVVMLIQTVWTSGGKFKAKISETQDRNAGGTLVNLLNFLRPYLPNRFVPEFTADADGKINGLARLKYLRGVAEGKDRTLPNYTPWWNRGW